MLMRLLRVLSFKSSASLRAYLMFATFAFFGTLILLNVTHTPKPHDAATAPTRPGQAASADKLARVEAGRVLAEQYCQACHLLPDPAWLDAESWKHGALPMMGPRLGIFSHASVEYTYNKADPGLPPNYYPTQPMVTETEWQSILDYYVTSAPARLPRQQRSRRIEMGLPLFAVEAPPVTYKDPVTSFVKILGGEDPRRLVVSDVTTEQTHFLDKDLTLLDTVQTVGAIVNMDVGPGGALLGCNIGDIHPNNEAFGRAQPFQFGPAGEVLADPNANLLGFLRRPAQVAGADLNNDGVRDYLVSEFGFMVGGLSWFEGRSDGGFKKHVLSEMAGPVRAEFQDYNQDGLMDFWVLFAQGREGVSLFTNRGNGRFREEVVLQFPPVYGSSYFELADFNADGHPDILYTCGDNADRTRVLKPYHGAYVFLNDGTNHFDQKYFFPIHGCYKAVARDFDGDGDLDVAAISFFADYASQPEEAFVYLQNAGGMDFQPYSIEEGKHGRWLTMDAGDVDDDGDDDLVLGNFTLLGSTIKSTYDWKTAPQFLLFRNQHKSPEGQLGAGKPPAGRKPAL